MVYINLKSTKPKIYKIFYSKIIFFYNFKHLSGKTQHLLIAKARVQSIHNSESNWHTIFTYNSYTYK